MNELLEKWDEILTKFRNEYDIHNISFDTWVAPLKVVSVENNVVKILCEEPIGLNHVESRYKKPLEVSISEVMGEIYKISLVLPSDNEQKEIPVKKEENLPKSSMGLNLNPNYTFDKFVVGPNNNLAHAASLAVAESPGRVYNPLFLHGGVGLGKTHLMQAIAHFILETNPSLKVLYVTSETFTNELIDSVRNQKNQSFRDKYRNIDVLLIDDIQFIIGKETTQEEFFHTFNDLYQLNKQIIITSDKPPKEMETLTERLRTRFSEGLICDIQIPTYETKMAILNKKIEDKGQQNIPYEVRDYVAKNIKSSVRELEGAITKLSAYADLSRSPVTLDLAMDALKDLVSPEHKKLITPELIIEIVADHYLISTEDILSKKRSANIAHPRQVIMYLCRQMTQESAIDIAKKLGKNDHSTILFGAKKIAEEILKNEKLKTTIDILIKKIDPS